MNSNKYILLLFSFIILGCKSPEARKPLTVKTGSFIEASAERNKELNDKEHEVIKKIMSNDTINDYIATKNGFWYTYNLKIDSLNYKPQFGDIINFNYNIKNLNGELIYSKKEIKTQNYIMDKEELFSGLREGLKLLKSGEAATFIFPSQKAFGYYGDEKKIGTNIPIICDVKINSITKNKTQD